MNKTIKLLFGSSHESDMRYVVGLDIHDPFFVLFVDKKGYVFLDHREIGLFQEKNKNPQLEAVLLNSFLEKITKDQPKGAHPLGDLAFEILRAYDVADVEIHVPGWFPIALADDLRSRGVMLTPQTRIFPRREIKTVHEQKCIAKNLKKLHKIYKKIETILAQATIEDGIVRFREKNLTSEFLKTECEKILLKMGLANDAGIIISCGVHSAMPHHPGSGNILAGKPIVCDIFPRNKENGYFADMTRTYIKGQPDKELVALYTAVKEAQERAIEKAKPGVGCSDVHRAVVDFFLAKGYEVGDQGFVHSTGHGLGVDVHEPPFLNASSQDTLKPGHVVTIEPGLYYQELGGVRIEDVIVITKNGCKNLTNYPKNFIIP